MPQLVTIGQAARNALAIWLADELADAGVRVEPRWVEADQRLAPKHITIIGAGPPEIEWLQPEVVRADEVDGDATKRDFIWVLGEAQHRLQLDVWAQSDVELDDLVARLDGSLNRGARGLGIAKSDPVTPGLLLELEDGWEPGIASFLFDQPDVDETASSVLESEWRATYRGRVSVQMTQRARDVRMARVLLQQRLRERDPVDPDVAPDVSTFPYPPT